MNAIKRHLPTASRIVLGLVFVVFGLNGFLHFLPQPPVSPRAGAFAGALLASGYLFPLLKAVEVTAGVLLLSRVAVPFALTLLAPIIVNIAGFHLAMAPEGLPIVALVLATELHLAWSYRRAFAPLFSSRLPVGEAQPATAAARPSAQPPRAAAA
jgi:hypothetical protein